MTLTIAYNPPLDHYSAWLAINGAAYCKRTAATITAAACERNRRKNYVDCRCNGCGGLDNQAPPALELVWDVDKTTATARPSTAAAEDRIEGLDALDEIIDGMYENPASGDDFNDVELDLDDEELLKLFPELAGVEDEATETDFKRFTEYQITAPRRAVYRGRCKKCGGYVEDTRERQDDSVFRCLACGWRTGVEYEINRAIYGVKP